MVDNAVPSLCYPHETSIAPDVESARYLESLYMQYSRSLNAVNLKDSI